MRDADRRPAPYLSIVLTGRNDNYGGDFNERLFRALRFNDEHLTTAGLDYEVVLVEWAPVPGRPYLAEVLSEELPDFAASRLTTYIVDARYQEAFTLNPSVRFMEFAAKNVGIRRATGEFVLSSNTDIYYSQGLVDVLSQRRLEPKLLYLAARVDLKLGLDLSHVEWALLENPRNHNLVKSIAPPFHTGASGDFQLLDRVSYHQLEGFNEVYRLARTSVDTNFCRKAYSNGYRIVDVGSPVYHLNHIGSTGVMRDSYADRPGDAPWGRKWSSWVSYSNWDGWGLARAKAQPLGEHTYYLDFTWDAVPPLVDLRRVLTPASREDGEYVWLLKRMPEHPDPGAQREWARRLRVLRGDDGGPTNP